MPMPISRRQFFRRFLGPDEPADKERKDRIVALEAFLRENVSPYDFCLDPQQTAELYADIQAGIDSLDDEDLYSYSSKVRALMETLTRSRIDPWRETRWKADEIRNAAAPFIDEFLRTVATAEDLEQLRRRFNVPYPASVEEAVENQARTWLYSLSDALLAEYTTTSIRELVFSELRSWC